MASLGRCFEDFEQKGCKIIHPDNAAKAADAFNSLPFEFEVSDPGTQIDLDHLTNAEPNEEA